MGNKGRDILLEIQRLLVEIKDGFYFEFDDSDESNQIGYTIFFPLIEGSFTACLQGNDRDELKLCIENSDFRHKCVLA
ncbi:hypothetical protein AHAS_Ahas06G0237000 [Arachis hypogaea]